jgi:xylulokinase
LTIDRSGRVQTLCHALPQRYQLLAVTPVAKTSLQWWNAMLGGRMTEDELIKLAESVPAGADGLLFLPGRASTSDGDPRGAFVGLRAHHTPAHLTRAVIEGIVLNLRAELDAMQDIGVVVATIRATGVGAKRGFWRRLQADIFDRPVQHTDRDVSPAYGAALLAGVAAGSFRDVEQAASLIKVDSMINQPDPNRAQVYESIYGRFKQLDPALRATASTPTG